MGTLCINVFTYDSCIAMTSNILAIFQISMSLVSDNSANFAAMNFDMSVSKDKKNVVQTTIAALKKNTFDFSNINFFLTSSAVTIYLCVSCCKREYSFSCCKETKQILSTPGRVSRERKRFEGECRVPNLQESQIQ